MRREAFARLVTPDAYVQARGIGPVVDELEAVFGRDLASPPPITGVQLRALRAHDERGRLSELRSIPTLVVSARHDPIARPEFGRTLAEGAGAGYLLWEDASHALPIQHAAALNERLRAHWAGSSLTRGGCPPGDPRA
jgi:pimeloyl-ACP methyl ester carboxylesterase